MKIFKVRNVHFQIYSKTVIFSTEEKLSVDKAKFEILTRPNHQDYHYHSSFHCGAPFYSDATISILLVGTPSIHWNSKTRIFLKTSKRLKSWMLFPTSLFGEPQPHMYFCVFLHISICANKTLLITSRVRRSVHCPQCPFFPAIEPIWTKFRGKIAYDWRTAQFGTTQKCLVACYIDWFYRSRLASSIPAFFFLIFNLPTYLLLVQMSCAFIYRQDLASKRARCTIDFCGHLITFRIDVRSLSLLKFTAFRAPLASASLWQA